MNSQGPAGISPNHFRESCGEATPEVLSPGVFPKSHSNPAKGVRGPCGWGTAQGGSQD